MPEYHKRLTRLDFEEDELDYGDVQATGYLWRDLYKRRRQERWLDECSDPPEESVLYGESLVIDGVIVGEWRYVEKPEPGPKPSHHAGARPLTEKELAWLLDVQRNGQKKAEPEVESDEEDRQRIRAELRRMPVPPELLQRYNESSKERFARKVERERERVARRKRESKIIPVAKPPAEWQSLSRLGLPVQRPPLYPRESPTVFGIPIQFVRPRPIEEPPERERRFVRIVSKNGIEHIVPIEVYTEYAMESLPLGIDPPIWVLHRLGIDVLP